MILVLLGIFVLVLIAGIFIYTKFGNDLYSDDMEWIYYAVNAIGVIGIAVSIAAAVIIGGNLTNRMIIDDKITLYCNENAVIEQQISDVVESYMDYEKETFSGVKSESAVTLVSLFPELKSDALVSKQIEVYTANNQKIKELKEEKLGYRTMAWWLYFGS